MTSVGPLQIPASVASFKTNMYHTLAQIVSPVQVNPFNFIHSCHQLPHALECAATVLHHAHAGPLDLT